MSFRRKNTVFGQAGRSKSVASDGSESPDLLLRCGPDVLQRGCNARMKHDFSTNDTERVISKTEEDDDGGDDDEEKSLSGDVTAIMEPDIIVDYVRPRPSPKQSPSLIVRCQTPVKPTRTFNENKIFIRCKPLKDLLSPSKIISSIKNQSDSDSSSADPLSPPLKRCKLRRIITSNESRSDTDIDNRAESNKYHPMKNWNMREANLPTSESDESDGDIPTRKIYQQFTNTHSRNRESSEYCTAPSRKKRTPKRIVDKNYRAAIRIDETVSKFREHKKNSRSARIKARDRIKQLLDENDDSSCSISSNSNNSIEQKNDKLNPKIVKENLVSEKSDSKILSKSDLYEQWIKSHSYVEELITRKHECINGVNYKEWERIGMIWYLLKTRNVHRARSVNVWKEMREDGYLRHRSYSSLHNHLRKSILPNLKRFFLPPEIIEDF